MGKLLTFFLIIFSIGTIMSATIEQESAFAVTTLSADMTNGSIADIQVASTDDFLDSDYIWIEGERIYYASKDDTTDTFSGIVRAQADDNNEGGTASAHSAGAKVMNDEASVLNLMIGYNIMGTKTELGLLDAPKMVTAIFTRALPKIMMWDYSYLQGDLVYLKYALLYPLSIGFLIAFIGWAVPLIRSILPF
jgi:hypothetical protein